MGILGFLNSTGLFRKLFWNRATCDVNRKKQLAEVPMAFFQLPQIKIPDFRVRAVDNMPFLDLFDRTLIQGVDHRHETSPKRECLFIDADSRQ
jgi:hypothetical protein